MQAVSSSPAGARPCNTLLLITFALLSAAGAWFMRVSLILYDAPKDFLEVVQAGVYPNGTPIKKDYTGLAPLDEGLSFLVAAFLPGAAGWNETFYWQQFHFLIQITGLIAIMNVEACRERNSASWIKYTAVWAFVYQNVGGAVIITLWMLLFHRLSGRNSYFQSGRAVPLPYAKVILPGTILQYLIPTIAIFISGQSITMLQGVLAFWQFAPVLANIPLWFVSPFVSTTPASEKTKTADIRHLKIIYNTVFVISVISHWITIYKVASSENPEVTFVRVFLPSREHWLTSMDEGLLWIFQWDWIIFAACYLISALTAIYDIQRLVPDIDTDPEGDKIFKGVYMVVALTVLGGPGAALSGVWSWREEQLAVLEKRAEKASLKKAT
ncbi:hypothetical protein HBH68_065640 [Parastagonospora nodorum]|nr:hypothetical protein HBH47_045210 [Parastagonospora nodorum]KAH5214245.1 hypothetical protein HBH68_065640 [Parastagonospora nodorum]